MKFLTILICKVIKKLGSLIGRGSSLPGKVALKINPSILSQIELPKHIIAVTGSNGKTSTVDMIADCLKASGKTVVCNSEGSNQIEGVATTVLSNANCSGKLNADVLLIETDERFARHTFKYLKPTIFVITNLFRDQLTRNGHPEHVFDVISEAIYPEMTLLLNADDPLSASFSKIHEKCVFYGIDELPILDENKPGIYDDGAHCPCCLEPMEYSYRHYNHIGKYECTSCDWKRPVPTYTISNVQNSSIEFAVNGKTVGSCNFISTSFYHLYNLIGAFAACSMVGCTHESILQAFSAYKFKTGRVLEFKLGLNNGTFLLAKHENSVAYDCTMQTAINSGEDFTLLVIVDAISRKYFTSETSWLWDINFEKLGISKIKKLVLAGTYVYDLASRIAFTDIPKDMITLCETVDEACVELNKDCIGHLYVLTCFSDKQKFLDRVEVL